MNKRYPHCIGIMDTSARQWVLICSFLKLPAGFEIDETSVTLVDLKSSEFQQVQANIKATDVVLKHLLRNGDQFIILEHYFQDSWLRWGLVKVPNQESIGHDKPNYKEQVSTRYDVKTLDEWCDLSIEDILPYWKEDRQKIPDGDMPEQLPLVMKPPGFSYGKEMVIDEHGSGSFIHRQELDPSSYLQQKYYEMIYSLNDPLAHFVKSKLSRLKVLCKRHGKAYQTVLKSSLVDQSTFEQRHHLEHCGLLKYESIPDECKDFRVRSIRDTLGVDIERMQNLNDVISDISNILKVRDIKLQIMILLELLTEGKLDSTIKQYETNHANKLNEGSFNMMTTMTRFSRRRNKGKSSKSVKQLKVIDYCQNLDILLDKLGIAEALISTEISLHSEQPPINKLIHEYKQGIVNKNKEISSKGFLSYVVVPYWYKKLPFVVTFITNKIKGPTMEKKPMTNAQQTNSNRSRAGSISSVSDGKRSSPQMPPLLRTRTNSNLVEFLEEETTKKKPKMASRSSSDLKLNRLQKRQMSVQDLSLDDIVKQRQQILEEFSTVRTVLVNGKAINISQSHNNSFQRVGKRKLASYISETGFDDKQQDIHVTATPIKPIEEKKDTPVLVASPSVVSETPIRASPVKVKTRHVRRRLFAP